MAMIEEEMLRFLRRSFYVPRDKIKGELEKFLDRIKQYEKNRFQTRVFVYLDIISWVESKVYNKPMSAIISEKFKQGKRHADVVM